ncbi:hypothetical protein R1sor_027153 [Riccia sorocarpa]|uniref:Uncharacterized protein n=1 Tax=Riccia sorocarpa TaxID=122646 RepID=A0ABD3GDF0_9MARC
MSDKRKNGETVTVGEARSVKLTVNHRKVSGRDHGPGGRGALGGKIFIIKLEAAVANCSHLILHRQSKFNVWNKSRTVAPDSNIFLNVHKQLDDETWETGLGEGNMRKEKLLL